MKVRLEKTRAEWKVGRRRGGRSRGRRHLLVLYPKLIFRLFRIRSGGRGRAALPVFRFAIRLPEGHLAARAGTLAEAFALDADELADGKGLHPEQRAEDQRPDAARGCQDGDACDARVLETR